MSLISINVSRSCDRLRGSTLALLVVIALITPASAFAYVDPGTGTVLWQLLLGMLVGVGFYSRKILGWFTGKR
ncbi:MAG: hypothetical protein LC114_14465 [Bryobacterales bacterium]|nr:hypothetical protein [Bryobacterales bacterium]